MDHQRQAIGAVGLRIADAEEGQLLLQDRERRLQTERGQQRTQPGTGGQNHPVGVVGALRRPHPHPVAIRLDG
jgi:hypothetical protein